ncbi:HNH endonuclease [Agromyces archimandritae]|uniref:HNH endonuclease n=1 Tax=Agromyces archimandritae TaxID=2781962 RepID=A0A975FLM7_9MICO|nr:HNH endonuclease [Agromyces archimandritae]QTX04007.1 HNH endonuclease [Agromyces archimandritae]
MRTLVLNASYEPLAVVSFRRAVMLVMHGKAAVLAQDEEHPVCAASGQWPRPSVILLHRYVRAPHTRPVPVTRRGVLRRDEHRCAYCGAHATTIDHVVPRSRGGAGSWENLVACCLRCNNRKSDATLAELGWELRSAPTRPGGRGWIIGGFERPLPEWGAYLAA